jgi:hypothetical protein
VTTTATGAVRGDPPSKTERRVRSDYSIYELQSARVRVARKEYACCAVYQRNAGSETWYCANPIVKGADYARTSETRLPFCNLHFTPNDVVSLPKRQRGAQ